MTLRLPVGDVTVLLGSALARRRVMAHLDDGSARCGSGHGGVGVRRLQAAPDEDATARLDAVSAAAGEGAPLVLVDRFTDGLSTADRRAVLTAVRALAGTGTAVLVDDVDPVAALAVADDALRVGPDGLVLEPVGELYYRAS